MKHHKARATNSSSFLSGLFIARLRYLVAFALSVCIANAAFASGVVYVQGYAITPAPSETSVAVTYGAAQTAGNLNVVVISWNDSTTLINSVTDTLGNTYVRAVGPTISAGNATQSMYYAKNIAASLANGTTLTVKFNALARNVDIRIAEYSGVDRGAPLDGAIGANGSSATSSSGSLTTVNANDLLVAGNYVANSTTGPGTGYTQRLLSQDSSILEDRIVTTTGTYTATAPQSPSGWWVMQVAAFKAAAAGGDTTPPTAPTNLAATAASSTQTNLSWTAATDNVAVSGYRVERCAGAGCATFTQVATTTTTSYTDSGLLPSTSYTYRVRATDTAGNFGSYSGTQSSTTLAGNGSIAYVQGEAITPSSSLSSITITYPSAQTAGNLNVVLVGWGGSSTSVASITDTKGNSYVRAVGPTLSTGNASQSIYYAKNIASATAGGNAVTITFGAAVARIDVRISEYSGVDTTNPLDVAVGSSGSSATASSGALTTTNSTDLLVAGNVAANSTTGAGSSYTARLMSHNATILEDQFVSATNTYTATAPLSASGWWVMQLAAFKAVNSGTDTTPPSAPGGLGATATSSTQINLNWTASTDNVGVTGYKVERCSGSSCSSFAQIATSTGTTFSDTGLTASTSYSYRVRATDAAGNLSAYSSTASTTTQAAPDTTPPTSPSGLSATAASSTQINLSWTASTDNVGVTGYKVERCQGASCTTFAQIGTPTTTTYSDTSLTASTSYSYRVRATDAAGNLSAYSSTASATTPAAPDTQAPSAPTNLSATAASSTQVNLHWTASTDNVGVTGYKVERCSGSGCSNFAQVATPTTTSYSDTGLTASTNYSYRVRATDAAGNLSSYSSTSSATTPAAPDTSPPTAPSGLTAIAASSTQINLNWTASTDNVGVTGYKVERCSGSSCSSFAQIATPTGTTFSDVGLTASTSYSYRVRATDAAGNLSAYSSTASTTTQALLAAPTALIVTAASNQELDIGWTASTSNTVTGYLIERCLGAGCSAFAQIGTTNGVTYDYDVGLTANTNYSYRIRSVDGSGNTSTYSAVLTAATLTTASCD